MEKSIYSASLPKEIPTKKEEIYQSVSTFESFLGVEKLLVFSSGLCCCKTCAYEMGRSGGGAGPVASGAFIATGESEDWTTLLYARVSGVVALALPDALVDSPGVRVAICTPGWR
jgi:hypothetical protein